MTEPAHAPAGDAVRVALIASVARNGVIGSDNTLVWHEPADQRWFRQQTMGCPVVMGRKTWDSLPPRFRPLPGRANIVVTRQPGWQAAGAKVVQTLADGLQAARHAAQAAASVGTSAATSQAATPGQVARVFVIGGGQLFAEALPLADDLVLTEIDADLPGDIRFPVWDRAAFVETAREPHTSAGPPPCGYAFVIYRRRR